MATHSKARSRLQAGILAGSLLVLGGCSKFPSLTKETPQAAPAATPAPAPRSDQDIAADIQSRISGQSALNGQNIQVAVNGGTATLNGTVNNDASRALAAAESGGVNGVRTVINNLTVAPAQAAVKAPPAPRAPAPRVERQRHRGNRDSGRTANPEAMNEAPVQPQPAMTPKAPPAPVKPAAPVARTVSVAAGTSLPVRLTDALDSGTTQTGQAIHGTLTADIIANNMVAIPRGTPVVGRVVQAKDATHFAGSSLLSIELTQVELKGQPLSVVTTPFSQQGKGRGKNTAMKTGGGAAIGAIIGALAGGGKGAAIGAASGGGLGAGVNAVTRGDQVKIPAESLITFKLQSPINVTTSRTASAPAGGTFDENDSNPDQPQQDQPQ
jgi:BON domain-containing protein